MTEPPLSLAEKTMGFLGLAFVAWLVLGGEPVERWIPKEPRPS